MADGSLHPGPMHTLPPSPPWPAALAAARHLLRGFHNIPEPVRDELAQEAVARALGVDEVAAPLAFTRRIARNLAISWLRKGREELWTEPPDPGSSRWERRTDARLDARRALQVLESAPPAYRDIVRRCFLEDDDVDALVDEERQPGEARHRVQDRIYKRRTRGLAWTRRHLEAS